jgi:Putative lumazine-binding
MKRWLIAPMLLGCLFASAQNDETQIKQCIQQLFDGMRTVDSTKLRSVFSTQAILRTIVTTKEGKTVVREENLNEFVKSVGTPHEGVYDEQVEFSSIKIDGSMAFVWAPYKFYLGKTFSHCGVDGFQMIKQDNKWLILYLIDTRRKTGCE